MLTFKQHFLRANKQEVFIASYFRIPCQPLEPHFETSNNRKVAKRLFISLNDSEVEIDEK